MITLALSLLTPLLLGQANSAAAAEAARLNACIVKTGTDPEDAYEDGIKWLYEGKSAPAQQCTAMALIALGQAGEGAARLETLANSKEGGSLAQREIYLAQAGNAWLLAGAPDAAVITLANAIKLKPDDADLHKDRARAFLMMEKWTDAQGELDQAVKLSPGDGETLRLRAQAKLGAGQLDAAASDIKQARKMLPHDVPTAVMRGRIVEARRLKGLPDDPAL